MTHVTKTRDPSRTDRSRIANATRDERGLLPGLPWQPVERNEAGDSDVGSARANGSAPTPASHGHSFGHIGVIARAPVAVQPKLQVNKPGDRFEQEADRVAEEVVGTREPDGDDPTLSGSTPCSQCAPRIQRSTFDPIEREEEEQEQGQVQAKEQPGAAPEANPGLDARIASLPSGSELPRSLRSYMEPRFGHDFGAVRIHTDSDSAELAESINARAFTLGSDLVFARDQFSPDTLEGRRLIAHELTHVVQQGQHGQLVRSVQRVAWNPNTDTGNDSHPWGVSGPNGDVLTAATDAGTALDIWRPHNGTTYWCHGYTFGGSTATGGPYSFWGSDVNAVLSDDGWTRVPSCMASNGDVMAFFNGAGEVAHTGIIRSVSVPNSSVDEATSTVESKWGQQALSTDTWLKTATHYGNYHCFSKSVLSGPCADNGPHEQP